MSDQKTRLVLDDFSGGRNGADTPLGPHFEASQVVDAVNVDWYRTTGARKRWGSSVLAMTGATVVGIVSWLGRHVPGISDGAAELWLLDEIGPTPFFWRLAGGTTWAGVFLDDYPLYPAPLWEVTSASLNGLFFIAYKSSVNRLHVYDPGANRLRRTGVDPGLAAPTVANQGSSGTYAPTLRYYRVCWVVGGTARRSGPTPSVGFTPSGTGLAARITAPAVPPNEGITHWEIEESVDNATFYRLVAVERGNHLPIATTFWDHTTNPPTDITSLAAAGLLSSLTGTFGLQKSYRLIAADQNRLIGWGSWTSSDKQNRLEISAIVGSLDKMDAERVDMTTNYFIDFDELDSGPPMALVGPVWDHFYAFKSRQMFELIPTGSIEQPYRRIKISAELGCVSSHGACRGEDGTGSPCLYILTHRGVYRYGLNGFQYIGRGIEDMILGPTSLMNMAATNVIGHLVFYPDLNQLWVWFATGSNNDPNMLCVLDVSANQGRGGWTRYTGEIKNARCSVMFANTIAASMGFPLVPYVGSTAGAGRILKVADSQATSDSGVTFQATVTTRPLSVSGFRVATGDVQVLAPSASGVTLTCTAVPDFGASPTVSGTATLTPTGSETRVTRPFSGSALGGSEFTQLTIGDAAPSANKWSLDRVIVPIHDQEPVTG